MNSATMRSPFSVVDQSPINVDRGLGFFKSAGERDADIGVFRFAGSIDDATHYGKL